MKKTITLKKEYTSLDEVLEFLKKESKFECFKDYDKWDVRTDSNNQMEKSIVIKKSYMHGMNVYFVKKNTLQIMHVIPNTIMNAYFGKSQKKYKNILEIITGKITQSVLSGSQKKAFDEIENAFKKILA